MNQPLARQCKEVKYAQMISVILGWISTILVLFFPMIEGNIPTQIWASTIPMFYFEKGLLICFVDELKFLITEKFEIVRVLLLIILSCFIVVIKRQIETTMVLFFKKTGEELYEKKLENNVAGESIVAALIPVFFKYAIFRGMDISVFAILIIILSFMSNAVYVIAYYKMTLSPRQKKYLNSRICMAITELFGRIIVFHIALDALNYNGMVNNYTDQEGIKPMGIYVLIALYCLFSLMISFKDTFLLSNYHKKKITGLIFEIAWIFVLVAFYYMKNKEIAEEIEAIMRLHGYSMEKIFLLAAIGTVFLICSTIISLKLCEPLINQNKDEILEMFIAKPEEETSTDTSIKSNTSIGASADVQTAESDLSKKTSAIEKEETCTQTLRKESVENEEEKIIKEKMKQKMKEEIMDELKEEILAEIKEDMKNNKDM